MDLCPVFSSLVPYTAARLRPGHGQADGRESSLVPRGRVSLPALNPSGELCRAGRACSAAPLNPGAGPRQTPSVQHREILY